MISKILNVVISIFLFLPQCQILFQQLNDWLGISEVIFSNIINLFQCLLKTLICQLNSLFVIFHDFIVKDWEVQSKSQFDWVASMKLNFVCWLVGLESFFFNVFQFFVLGSLCNVPVVICNHLEEKSFCFILTTLRQNSWLNSLNDHLAIHIVTFFNFLLILS